MLSASAWCAQNKLCGGSILMSSEMLPFSRSLLTCPTAETADIADTTEHPPDARAWTLRAPRQPAQSLRAPGCSRKSHGAPGVPLGGADARARRAQAFRRLCRLHALFSG